MSFKRPHYFGIGWPKTGTNSLTAALEQLDVSVLHLGQYHVAHPDETVRMAMSDAHYGGADDPLLVGEELVQQYTCLVDWPVYLCWQKLLACDDTAKFIITYRNPHDIAFAMARHNWRHRMHNRQSPFPVAYSDAVREIEQHYTGVFAAALERPRQFLILAVTDSDEHKWKSLCHFVGVSCEKIAPAGQFPEWPRSFTHEEASQAIIGTE